MFDGLKHHIEVWRESWRLDREAQASKQEIKEKEFLPAALEIVETPASPFGRTIMWTIVTMLVLTAMWSYFSFIDVVAVSTGQVMPRSKVKVVQAAEGGIVRAIHVHDGSRVKAGDVLVELDTVMAGAEMDQMEEALRAATILQEQALVLRDYQAGKIRAIVPAPGMSASEINNQRRLIASRIAEYEATLDEIADQTQERAASLRGQSSELRRLQETLPLIEQQLKARQILAAKGLTPRLVVLELEERLINHTQSIEIQKDRVVQARASLAGLDKQSERVRQTFASTVNSELVQSANDMNLREGDLVKATKRKEMKNLVAPVDGIVQQLAIHTIGGVVEPAKPLMVVVPGGELVAQALVLNKDIGFVEEGQHVAVKLQAFPFTKYGLIDGTIENLSLDAIQHEQMGLVYAARIRLDRQDIMVNGRMVPLTPGMSLSAEVKLDERRLIEFFMAPLLRYKAEALRER